MQLRDIEEAFGLDPRELADYLRLGVGVERPVQWLGDASQFRVCLAKLCTRSHRHVLLVMCLGEHVESLVGPSICARLHQQYLWAFCLLFLSFRETQSVNGWFTDAGPGLTLLAALLCRLRSLAQSEAGSTSRCISDILVVGLDLLERRRILLLFGPLEGDASVPAPSPILSEVFVSLDRLRPMFDRRRCRSLVRRSLIVALDDWGGGRSAHLGNTHPCLFPFSL